MKQLSEFTVAFTAFLTSFWKDQARSKENWEKLTITLGSRPKPLFKDPYLKLFYNDAIAAEGVERLDQRMWLPLATRTRYFRRTISQAVKEQGIEQILILGSGFDTLAVRKAKYSQNFGVRFFEIDRPEIMECKQAIFSANGLDKNAVYVGLDYTQEKFISKLKEQGLDPNKPTFVLWEGNTFYLEKEKVIETLATLAQQFPKLLLSFDFMHDQIQEETQTLDSFAKKNSPFKAFFNPDEIMKICQEQELSCQSHFNTAELAKLYDVDKTPYHTAEPYSVITFGKGM